jgi:hypothetical protein
LTQSGFGIFGRATFIALRSDEEFLLSSQVR